MSGSTEPAPRKSGFAQTCEYDAYIARALATEGGHLSIGHGGATLHFERSRLSGCAEDVVKAAAIAAGLPVIDSRKVPFETSWALAVRGPMIEVDEAPSSPPYLCSPTRRPPSWLKPTERRARMCSTCRLRLIWRSESKRAAPVFVTGWRSRESLSAARRGDTDMATAVQKITLSASRDIPFNKLVLSQANVRRVKAGVSIEELAEDIARRTLLQSLSVRPVLDAEGAETGMFEIPAGGRRFRALELLVKQKRLAKTAPVPCVVRDRRGIAEEDSLAENIQRVALHPLDQFRAFKALRDKGARRRGDRRAVLRRRRPW